MAVRSVLKLVAEAGGGGFDSGAPGVFIGQLATAAISPAQAAAATATKQDFTLTGAKVGDVVLGVTKPTDQTGLAIANCAILADDTISIKFVNPTAGALTPTASQVYTFVILRINS